MNLAPQTTIPLFSLTILEKEILSSENAARTQFKKILKNNGLFYLSDHGIDPTVIQDVIDVTEAFFQKPEETVKEMVHPNILRGITLLEGESTGKAVQTGDQSDLCMKYSMGVGDNIFPDETFQARWEAYFEEVSNLARRVLSVIGITLGLDQLPNWQSIMDGDPLLRHLSYPDTPLERCADACQTPERMARHHDLDLITLLYQTACPNGFTSLQAEVDGEYKDIPSIDGTFVVNFGEVLSFLTSGEVKAPLHRVMAPLKSLREGSRRTSTICFFQPKPDFLMAPFKGSMNPTSEKKPYKIWMKEALDRFACA